MPDWAEWVGCFTILYTFPYINYSQIRKNGGKTKIQSVKKMAVHSCEKNFYRIDRFDGSCCNETTTCISRSESPNMLFGIIHSRDRVGKIFIRSLIFLKKSNFNRRIGIFHDKETSCCMHIMPKKNNKTVLKKLKPFFPNNAVDFSYGKCRHRRNTFCSWHITPSNESLI